MILKNTGIRIKESLAKIGVGKALCKGSSHLLPLLVSYLKQEKTYLVSPRGSCIYFTTLEGERFSYPARSPANRKCHNLANKSWSPWTRTFLQQTFIFLLLMTCQLKVIINANRSFQFGVWWRERLYSVKTTQLWELVKAQSWRIKQKMGRDTCENRSVHGGRGAWVWDRLVLHFWGCSSTGQVQSSVEVDSVLDGDRGSWLIKSTS